MDTIEHEFDRVNSRPFVVNKILVLRNYSTRFFSDSVGPRCLIYDAGCGWGLFMSAKLSTHWINLDET